MARPKKTTTKKTTTRKTTAKKATAKRTPKATTATAKSQDAIIKMLKGTPSTKRPPNNPDVPQATIDHLNTMLNDLKTILDAFAQHLRALDRKRLNGVGVRKLGFIRLTERGRGRACTDRNERVRTRRA